MGSSWTASGAHDARFNHRREHWETADSSLSFDPTTLTPAWPEPFARGEMARELAAELRAEGVA